MSARRLFGLIEAGGTKFVLAVARGIDDVVSTVRIPTTVPAETIGAALAFFHAEAVRLGPFDAFGIASFGPLGLDRASSDWGRILDTPKPGWTGTDLVGTFASSFGCPVGLDTDVNGAILAEHRWGAASGADIAVYVTIGTGIGGGIIVDGRPVHGHRHPEMGHMLPRRHLDDRGFDGTCPFHGDCLEGLASGPAIRTRWGCSLSELPVGHPGTTIVADYLAQLVVAQQAMLSPRRIVMGGGVMASPGLLDAVRARASALAAGYFEPVDDTTLIVRPELGDRAGISGALLLAQAALT